MRFNNHPVHLFLIVIFCLWMLPVKAQDTTPSANKISYRQMKKMQARQQIKQLKDGTLLVMLHTRSKSISALRKIGKDPLADKIATKQHLFNLEVVAAFKKHFNYCPTRFFFTDDAHFIAEEQMEKVLFLNENMQPDSSLTTLLPHFYIADFGMVQRDTAQFFSENIKQTQGNWNIRKTPVYYGSPDRTFNGLVIRSANFIQLRRPLPYYVRTFDSLFIKRSPRKNGDSPE